MHPSTRSFLFALAFLIAGMSATGFALTDVHNVTKESAKELGLEIRELQSGPDHCRVEVEFEKKGALNDFTHAELELNDKGKLVVRALLKPEPAKGERILVGFTADRAHLGKITLSVLTENGLAKAAHVIKLKDFVETPKAPKAPKAEKAAKAP